MMSDLVLADTTVWVHYLRGSNPAVKDRFIPLILENRLATADIIIMELLRGARSKKNYDVLYNDLIVLRRLPMDASFWNRAWKYGYQLRKNGINTPLADILIATLAAEHGALLLHNDRHFIMMEETMVLHHEFLQ
jgi:hypothetical protein